MSISARSSFCESEGNTSACGEHGHPVEVVDNSGERCECVCDEGWTTMQGGDVLLLSSSAPAASAATNENTPVSMSGQGAAEASGWCSFESAGQHHGGTVSPTTSTRLPGSGGGSDASAMAFLEVSLAQRGII